MPEDYSIRVILCQRFWRIDTLLKLSYNTVRCFDYYGMEHETAKETA